MPVQGMQGTEWQIISCTTEKEKPKTQNQNQAKKENKKNLHSSFTF